MCTSREGHIRGKVRGLLRWFFNCQKESELKPARPTLMAIGVEEIIVITNLVTKCVINDHVIQGPICHKV